MSNGLGNDLDPLDTEQIAHKVKELLVEHRIGQRLYAKVFLGITQARLSELLLKPKPWANCTEYRKTIYRRMHEWSESDESIAAMRALNPMNIAKVGLNKNM